MFEYILKIKFVCGLNECVSDIFLFIIFFNAIGVERFELQIFWLLIQIDILVELYSL